jgi:hypothetical protein
MRRSVIAGIAVLTLALAASSGVARAAATTPVSCSPGNTPAFAGVDSTDQNSYFLAPGGNFEGGAPGWTLAGGAALTAGHTTVGGPFAGTTSLSLPSGSSATSPAVCVGQLDPTLRFFVRNTGAAGSRLGVTVLYTLPNGKQSSSFVGSVTGSGQWTATPSMWYLKNIMTKGSTTGTTSVSFVFAPLDSTGKWQMDDLWIDPLKHR